MDKYTGAELPIYRGNKEPVAGTCRVEKEVEEEVLESDESVVSEETIEEGQESNEEATEETLVEETEETTEEEVVSA